MKLILFLFGLAYTSISYAIEDDDFWMMLNEDLSSSSLSINGGWDDDGGKFYGASINYSLTDNFYLNLAESTQELDAKNSQFSWGFSNSPYNDLTWNITKEEWGNSGELTTENIVLDLGLSDEKWNWSLGIDNGEVKLFGLAFSKKIDHEAHSIGLGYSGKKKHWQISYKVHDYDFDMKRLGFDQAEFNNHPYLILFITPDSQQQSQALADNELNTSIGWIKENFDVNLGYQLVESAVTGEKINTLISTSANKLLHRSTCLQMCNIHLIMAQQV